MVKCASQGSHEAEQTQGNEEHGIEWDQGLKHISAGYEGSENSSESWLGQWPFFYDIIYCMHTYNIYYLIYCIHWITKPTHHPALAILTASIHKIWLEENFREKHLKLLWFISKKANCAPGREIQVFARNSQDTRPSTESQWQRRAPRARPEPAESPSPLRCLGKNHRNCPSGPPTETFLRKWSTLCKPSVEILDLIKIYEQYKYSLTGFLAQTEIVLSFFLCLNVNLETRKQS